jgi:hypothetical protein
MVEVDKSENDEYGEGRERGSGQREMVMGNRCGRRRDKPFDAYH